MDRGRSETGRNIGEEKEVMKVNEKQVGGENREKGHKDRGGKLSVFKPLAI